MQSFQEANLVPQYIQMYFHNSVCKVQELHQSPDWILKGYKIYIFLKVITNDGYCLLWQAGKIHGKVFFILIMSLWQVNNTCFALPQLLFIEQ